MKRKYLWLAAITLVLGAGTSLGIFLYKENLRKQIPTGWKYDGPPNGGFDSVPYEDGEGPGLILVEGGAFTMGKDSSTVIIEGKEFTMGKMDSVSK